MILVVDDDKSIRLSLKLVLERNGYEVALADSPKPAIQAIRSTPTIELVLMDMNFSRDPCITSCTDGEEGLTLLRQVKVFRPNVPCILMTAWGTIDLAVRGMRAGAFDFITKPWDNGVLLDRIETARTLTSPPSPQGGTLRGSEGTPIIGTSLSGVLSTVSRVASTNAPVLITGESGTGKELIAEAIHRQSRRANGPFVKVNLGGISSSLFESEMFGHKRGAFTDAKADRVGRFALAEGGTIFLDEIGELSLASQVKLLRVLQDQTYEVLGDSETRRTDVRIVCATNADLPTMVREHTFREDLFYRINLISIALPPLRERREDIPPLVEYFLHKACAENNRPPVTVSAEATAYLQTLSFAGNIRELKNHVERAVLMMNPDKGQLGVEDFTADPIPTPVDDGSEGLLASIERSTIAASIARHGGNLSLVAKELGISRGSLYRKIEKYAIIH